MPSSNWCVVTSHLFWIIRITDKQCPEFFLCTKSALYNYHEWNLWSYNRLQIEMYVLLIWSVVSKTVWTTCSVWLNAISVISLVFLYSEYHYFTSCTESNAVKIGCFWPHPFVEQYIILIHKQFFSNCTPSVAWSDFSEEMPTFHIVVTVTGFVTLAMVTLVVWCSKQRWYPMLENVIYALYTRLVMARVPLTR